MNITTDIPGLGIAFALVKQNIEASEFLPI
jgi:hypothetical protein